MRWVAITVILCIYGMLKEFKPIEPFLFRYQQNYLNISGEILNAEVYPYWTYSYLIMLIPALLLTDILLYKPILMIQSISYISVWLTLIYGRSVFSQQIGQVLYGISTATDVAYFAYIYVKVERKHYAIVTVLTRAALEAGKCLSYILSQLIILKEWGDYLTLNYISLVSLFCTFFFAASLPFVGWRAVVSRAFSESKVEESTATINSLAESSQISIKNIKSNEKNSLKINSYSEFVVGHVKNFLNDICLIFFDSHVRKWALWWALTTCGSLQIGNYIQTLWGEVQKNVHNSKVYNGFVEGLIPLFAAIALVLLRMPNVDWAKWGEFCLAVAAFIDFLVLILLSISNQIFVMYAGYAIYSILYQCMITIAQFNIVCRIPANSCGFVFGFNMFIALALQTILTFILVDGRGPFLLHIRLQFFVYSGYHAMIALIFSGVLISRWLCGVEANIAS